MRTEKHGGDDRQHNGGDFAHGRKSVYAKHRALICARCCSAYGEVGNVATADPLPLLAHESVQGGQERLEISGPL
ncbi:MAG: hypothetical protein M3403_02890, partial [Gemmatimonadota bacterium]|nr:hypothetical protein [Gemmatimonadota bacterium]